MAVGEPVEIKSTRSYFARVPLGFVGAQQINVNISINSDSMEDPTPAAVQNAFQNFLDFIDASPQYYVEFARMSQSFTSPMTVDDPMS